MHMTSFHTGRRVAVRMAAAMVLCAFGLHAGIGHAQATNFPDRPIRWIVPWPPGGGADMLARMLNVKLGQVLGQPVVIDNRGGAGGNIGASAGAKATPDGYTMTFAYSATHSINPHVYPKMPFKESDFAPVIFISLVPQVVVVNASSPVHNIQEWLALAKKQQMTFASAGQGSIGHLGGELLASLTGVKMLHVPYKGGGPAMTAVLSGEVDALFGIPVVLAPQIKAGKLRAIGITTAMRTSVLPDGPTIAEQGVPGFDVSSWNGVHVPAGTPPEVIAKLNAAFNKVLADPEVRKQLIDNGYEIIGGEPAKFSSFVASELEKWKPVVKRAKVQIE
ncbi:tripartite tricarboxylate transporter substrate binding protein [Variovorax guangxiensis]|uniref:Bug family tripartite tricarboxylate transporter substrate binding protein n=1 Tax=Variovorax guangxiensis TaxID=1775474 RepID=UPI00285F8D0A|nr:tripartite tricarboxylate transporter substrate binding protein [Variovorax guangxiensis]MDR6860939.1 tripartite-type tricarboxylate transporter receptor subunit TctC [Variovorax guangxiensis]